MEQKNHETEQIVMTLFPRPDIKNPVPIWYFEICTKAKVHANLQCCGSMHHKSTY